MRTLKATHSSNAKRRGERKEGRPWVAGLILIGLAGVSLAACHRQPPGPSKELIRQRNDLSREIQKLRREVVMLQQSTKGAGQVDYSDWEKTSNDPETELQLLQKDVFRLARSLDTTVEHPPLEGTVLPFVATGTAQIIEVQIPEGSSSRAFLIANVGQNILKEPEIFPEGSVRMDSAEDILAGTLAGKKDDQEKAIALWDFVRKSRQHFFPSQQSSEAEDPVKLANIYGYGYCDDAATALAWLATAAGFQARVWDLKGHVVPEIYFQNSWHMLDPDEEVYYFDDHGAIASVDWLSQHPGVIANLQGGKSPITARLAEFYRTVSDNRLEKTDKEIKEPIHRIAFSLRPGEQVLFGNEPSGKFFSTQYYWSHPPHGTGRWNFTPVFTEDLFKIGANLTENIRSVPHDPGAALAPQDADHEATLVYEFSPSYPMLDGEVKGEAQLPEGARFFVDFSPDGQSWKQVAEIHGPLKGAWKVGLADYFPNGFGSPLYHCFLRLRIPRGKAESVLITHYQISFDLKVAPKSIPTLAAGLHRFQYLSKGTAADRAEIGFVVNPTTKTPQ